MAACCWSIQKLKLFFKNIMTLTETNAYSVHDHVDGCHPNGLTNTEGN